MLQRTAGDREVGAWGGEARALLGGDLNLNHKLKFCCKWKISCNKKLKREVP